jgi:hypothetical protein
MFGRFGLTVRKKTCYQDGAWLVVQVLAGGATAAHERLRLAFAQSKEFTLRKA